MVVEDAFGKMRKEFGSFDAKLLFRTVMGQLEEDTQYEEVWRI